MERQVLLSRIKTQLQRPRVVGTVAKVLGGQFRLKDMFAGREKQDSPAKQRRQDFISPESAG